MLHEIKKIGIRNKLHDWLKNLLSNRRQRVVINGVSSEWMPETSGVPQDSVLGSVHFVIYVNNIDRGLNNFFSKFADKYSIHGTGQVGPSRRYA